MPVTPGYPINKLLNQHRSQLELNLEHIYWKSNTLTTLVWLLLQYENIKNMYTP